MIHDLALIVLYDGDGKMLLQHRARDKFPYPDQWGMFGGHINLGETPDVAVCREAVEELGIDLKNPRLFGYYEYREFRMHIFISPLDISLDELRKRQMEGDALDLFSASDLHDLKTTEFNKEVLRKIYDSLLGGALN